MKLKLENLRGMRRNLMSKLSLVVFSAFVAQSAGGCATFNNCPEGQYKLLAGCYDSECVANDDCLTNELLGKYVVIMADVLIVWKIIIVSQGMYVTSLVLV